jgi:hypothetical protein
MLIGTIALLLVTPVLTIIFIYLDEKMFPGRKNREEELS